MGGIVGEDPVPMRNLSPSYRFVPTLTSWGETKAAWPRTYSTPFRDARTSAYFAFRRSATKRSFERTTARKSADHPSSRWSPGNGRFATRKNWSPTARRRLLGTQPTFTHVPPIVPPSIISALAPFRSARIAALNAAPPPPRITRSYRPAMRSPSVGQSVALYELGDARARLDVSGTIGTPAVDTLTPTLKLARSQNLRWRVAMRGS